MLFYKIHFISEEPLLSEDYEMDKGACRKIRNLSADSDVNLKTGNKFFVSWAEDCKVTICVALSSDKKADILCCEFVKDIEIKGKILKVSEITLKEYLKLLDNACSNDFLGNTDDIFEDLGIQEVEEARRYVWNNVTEDLINNTYDKKESVIQSRNMLCSASFNPEIERIYTTGSPNVFLGHPVHYSIISENENTREKMRELLLGMLFKKKRLVSRRYCKISITENCFDRRMRDPGKAIEELYTAQKGGAIVLILDIKGEVLEGEVMDSAVEEIMKYVPLIKKNRKDVLTIIELPRNGRLLKLLHEQLYGIAFIQLDEEIVMTKEAKKYLRRIVSEYDINDYSDLLKKLPEAEDGFRASELDDIFYKWYDNHLRTSVYSQYCDIDVIQYENGKKPVGDAYMELGGLIGLDNVKDIVFKMIDFHKAQKIYEEKGLKTEKPAMHMVFSGNPGTAKTTVARLIARIMKDNGLLSRGKLVEVGRSDLVGKYVGWTASLVKDMFRKAKGSVLFIDEAYSLLDHKNGMYGDEAINTIVQEMENMRDDIVVIFAGYPGEMKQFVERNPGLFSRVKFHIDFPDYTVDELIGIFNLFLEKQGRRVDTDALLEVREILKSAIGLQSFGNGRYVRNMIEKAIMSQASRLMKMKPDEWSKTNTETLITEDFDSIENKVKAKCIGFNILANN